MFRSAPQMSRQRRPHGPFYVVDNVWKAEVQALMEKKGISQAEMARRIGASPGSLVLLFKPATVQSRLVPAIHKVLGLDPPVQGATVSQRDDAKRRLDRIWNELEDEDRSVLLAIAERVRRPGR